MCGLALGRSPGKMKSVLVSNNWSDLLNTDYRDSLGALWGILENDAENGACKSSVTPNLKNWKGRRLRRDIK